MAKSIGAGELIRHRRRDRADVDPVEERFHVGQRRHVDPAFADLTQRERVIRVASHQRRQVEGHAEAGAAGREQLLVPLVCRFRRTKPGKLAHRPELAAVAGGVKAAGVRQFAGIAEIPSVVEVANLVRGVEPIDGPAGNRREALQALDDLRA
jgi:hypothetical protein